MKQKLDTNVSFRVFKNCCPQKVAVGKLPCVIKVKNKKGDSQSD